jgi:hypothetical protein
VHAVCNKNQQNIHFFLKYLIQLSCLRLVSKNKVFIIRKTLQAAVRYFIMHIYTRAVHKETELFFNLVLYLQLKQTCLFQS